MPFGFEDRWQGDIGSPCFKLPLFPLDIEHFFTPKTLRIMRTYLSSSFKMPIAFNFLFITFFISNAVAQKTIVGVNIGVSLNDLTEEYNWRNYSCKHGCDVTDVSPQSGRYYGLFFQKDLIPSLSLRAGVAYEKFGFEETIESVELVPILGLGFKGKPIRTQLETYTSTFETSYSALSFPLSLRLYALGANQSNRLFLDGGFVYHYKINESFTPYEQQSNTLYAHNLSTSGAIGYEKRWNAHSLYVSTSMSYSITNWNHDEVFQRTEKFRPIQMRFNIGYGYSL